MGPIASTDSSAYQYAQHRATLLELAHAAIRRGFDDRAAPELDTAVESYPKPLREARACFVTLRLHGQLRGCIGSLEAERSLVEDIRANAHAAAFRDPRFQALSIDEFKCLQVEISILDAPIALSFCGQLELRAQLRPGIDGLILAADGRRSTFLPSVWKELPDVGDFLRQLKLKAGLPGDYWSDRVRAWRYTTQSIA